MSKSLFRQNILQKSIVQWGTDQNVIFEFAVKEIAVLPTLTASQELKNWNFTMEFLSQHHLYVNYTCTKFQGQKIHQKKGYSKSTNMCSCEIFFIVANFDSLPRIEKKNLS